MEGMNDQLKKLEEERKKLEGEVREKTLSYILAAFGLIAGLAWNDAIKSLIEYFVPASTGTLFAKFTYAVLITLVVVIVSVYLTRLFARKDSENKL